MNKSKRKNETEETNVSFKISNRHEINLFKLLANKKSEILCHAILLNYFFNIFIIFGNLLKAI